MSVKIRDIVFFLVVFPLREAAFGNGLTVSVVKTLHTPESEVSFSQLISNAGSLSDKFAKF